jgi:signal transduction histidine kinase
MFALLVLKGPWMGLVLFVSSVSAGIIVRHGILGVPGMLGAAAIIACTYTIAALVARRYFKIDAGLGRLRDVTILLGIGMVATIVLALLITAMLLALGRLGTADITPAFARHLVGNIIGIAVVSPLVLRIARHWREGSLAVLVRGAGLEMAAYLLITGALLWTFVTIPGFDDHQYFYVLFLPVIVAAVRHGLDGACVSLAFTQVGLVAAMRHFSYDAVAFTEFQLVMFVLTATGLVVGAVVSERRAIDQIVRAAEAQLKEKESEAERAARLSLLSGMASSIAHDVSQPMTAARALARSAQQILRAKPTDLARADGNLANLISHIDHASGIIRRTRDFVSRSQPHPSTIDLRLLIEDALALIGPEAKARNIEIMLDVPEDLPTLHADRVQLQQLVLNLIRNSLDSITEAKVKHGRVRITACAEDGHILVSVADNGGGVEAEIADKLFVPLTTSKSDGLGLGLAICDSIVGAHGGKIWLHSNAPGATDFRFTLPLDQLRQTGK